MENVTLSNLDFIRLSIKVLFDEDPQTDYQLLHECDQLTTLNVSHLAQYYSGAVQPFIQRARHGIVDLAVLGQIVASKDWEFHSTVLGIDRCVDLYSSLNARVIKLHLRQAIKVADTYLGYPYSGYSATPDEMFCRMIAETLIYSQMKAENRYDCLVADRFCQYFLPESVQTSSDLECFIFSYNFVLDRINYSTNSLSKYLRTYYRCPNISTKKLTRYISRAKDYSEEYFPDVTPARTLNMVADNITAAIYPSLQEA